MGTVTTPTAQARVRTVLARFYENAAPGERLASLDVLRGLTILVMIFVNDVAGVAGAPAWMKHIQPADADGMTLADLVFPAFLFMVGMSIPFALERRLERGASLASTWRHILLRTVSLLVIGVFMVNTEQISDGALLPPSLWTLLMYGGVILVWLTPPRSWGLSPVALRALRIAGVMLLLVLSLVYRGPNEPGLIELRPYWWGILGIIGWSYLAATSAFLLFGRESSALLGAMALLLCLYVADEAGAFEGWLRWVDAGSVGAHGALSLAGVVLGVMLLPASPLDSHRRRISWALLYGLGLATAGLLLHAAADLHRIFIINKIFATIPFVLLTAAITIGVWIPIYCVLDAFRQRRWTVHLEHAGQNALLAYILAPIFYAAVALGVVLFAATNPYAALGSDAIPGILRAVVFAVAIILAAAVLRRKEYVLKL